MNIIHSIKKMKGIFRKNICLFENWGNVKAGLRVSFGKKVDVLTERGGTITFGNHCSVAQYGYISAIGGRIIIGDNTYFNRNINMVCREKIVIGKNCAIGPSVTIYDHDHNFGKDGKADGFTATEVIIDDNCWIGANVTILRGTHIGKNCVIGAGCVLKGNVPDNTVVIPEIKNKYINLQEKFETENISDN